LPVVAMFVNRSGLNEQIILGSDWLISEKIFSSETPLPSESNLVGSIL
jgi:hypothetical protein